MDNYLIKGETLTDIANGEVYGYIIDLGNKDSEDNYYEITIEEYEEILKKEELLENGNFIEN